MRQDIPGPCPEPRKHDLPLGAIFCVALYLVGQTPPAGAGAESWLLSLSSPFLPSSSVSPQIISKAGDIPSSPAQANCGFKMEMSQNGKIIPEQTLKLSTLCRTRAPA